MKYTYAATEDKKIICGIDVGTTKIVAMVGDKNEFGKVEIPQEAFIGVLKIRNLFYAYLLTLLFIVHS